MLVECILGQGELEGAVLGVGLSPQTTQEVIILAALLSDGASVSQTEGYPGITITPRSPVEEESEGKPSDEVTLETGHFVG